MTKWYCVTDYSDIPPEHPGCYAIYVLNIETRLKKLYYIGTAVNLSKRLRKHEVRKVLNALIDYPEMTYVKCKIILDTNERIKTEKDLIKRLKPRVNYG